MSDTIFALSSGALPAGIAVIRISGPQADTALVALAGSVPEPRRLSLRSLKDEHGGLVDEALVVRFEAPHTVTGETLVELHCHGGRAVVNRLLVLLGAMPGLREADPGEFTRRALMNQRLDLTEAEGLADLLSAETEWQRRSAQATAGGALSRQIASWRERLVLLAAEAEASIDYVDEDETELELGPLVGAAAALQSEWRDHLSQPRAELLQDGLKVVLAGPPNAGKSSLFNALVGSEKAIVTPIPGTTRDLIEARVDLDGIPLTFVDTAGLRGSADEVEQIGVARAEEAQRGADILLWLGIPEDAPDHGSVIKVASRSDEDPGRAIGGAIATSVVTGEGLDAVRQAIIRRAAELLPPPDKAALNRRQAQALAAAAEALSLVTPGDSLITAEALRQALSCLDQLTGRQSTEDVLDALFGRFCLGK